MNKILIVQHGNEAEVFPLLSLVIGLKKAHPTASIIWAGDPLLSDLVRYNKRIKRFIDIEREFTMQTLQIVFEAEICVNPSNTTSSRRFTSNASAKQIFGFGKDGAVSRQAEFFGNVLSGKTATNKTSLQLYYDLVGLRWQGEGYGLSYYPQTKQTMECGAYLDGDLPDDCPRIKMPSKVLFRLDVLNKYASIYTDDVFTAHASIALRKQCYFTEKLPYQIEFFGKGSFRHNS